jgi:hypothetical protein
MLKDILQSIKFAFDRVTSIEKNVQNFSDIKTVKLNVFSGHDINVLGEENFNFPLFHYRRKLIISVLKNFCAVLRCDVLN